MHMGLSYSVQKKWSLMALFSQMGLFCSIASCLYIILLIAQLLIKNPNLVILLQANVICKLWQQTCPTGPRSDVPSAQGVVT